MNLSSLLPSCFPALIQGIINIPPKIQMTMVILTSSPSTATSVDKKGQSVSAAFKTSSAFGCSLILQPQLFPQHLHNLFSTHAGHALPSLCLCFCLQRSHTSRERTAFQTSAQNILKSFHANSAYPTGPFLCPPWVPCTNVQCSNDRTSICLCTELWAPTC